MKMTVVNKEVSVGNIRIVAIASSSVFLIGDSKVINCASAFDTPPESLISGPLVPLSSTR